MSVRQYIGARYVPRFSDVNNGNWSSVYSYEPLIIVKNGNDYYTSKQSVPVGIQITNTDYWIKTGDYNGAIAHLQEEVDALSSRIAIKTTDWPNRKVLFIGDSYDNFVSGHSWINTCASILGISDFIRYSYGGAGFVGLESGYSLMSSGRLPAQSWSDENNITDIVICMGANDHTSDEQTIINAIQNTVDYMRGRFTGVKRIYIGMIGERFGSLLLTNQIVGVYEAYYKAAEKLGLVYINGSQYMMRDRAYMQSADRLHPTGEGVDRIGRGIAEGLINGMINVTFSKLGTVSGASNSYYKGLTTPNIAVNFHNGLYTIMMALPQTELKADLPFFTTVDYATYDDALSLPYFNDQVITTLTDGYGAEDARAFACAYVKNFKLHTLEFKKIQAMTQYTSSSVPRKVNTIPSLLTVGYKVN